MKLGNTYIGIGFKVVKVPFELFGANRIALHEDDQSLQIFRAQTAVIVGIGQMKHLCKEISVLVRQFVILGDQKLGQAREE